MKLGMPQLFEYDNLEENFRLAQKLGLDFIEFNLNFSSCRLALENGLLKDLTNKYQMHVTLHFYDEADFASCDEVVDAYLSLLKKYVSLGQGFVKQMNVHLIAGPIVTISGVKHYVYEKEFDEYIARLIKNLKKAEDICRGKGINLVIENTDTLPEYVKRTYLDLSKNNFRFCYDIGHDHLCHDLLWHLLKAQSLPFDEFHIHDAKERKYCHLSLGEGELDIAKFKTLADKNNAFVVLEVKQESDLIKSVPLFLQM